MKDTDATENLLSTIMHSLIPNIIGVLGAIIISVLKNGVVSLFFLIVIPVNVLISFAFRKKLRKVHHDHRVNTEKMSAKLSTMIEMVPVTKSHGLEQMEIASVDRSIKSLIYSGRSMDKKHASFGSASWVVNELLRAINLIFCVVLALKKIIPIGDIVLYQSMFSQISGSVSSLVNLVPAFSSGLDALSSVSELMNEKDIEVTIGKSHVEQIEGNVQFNNVYYKYPDLAYSVCI